MWTINFKRNDREFTASFTSEFQTDSPALEILFLTRLNPTPTLLATPTGPSAELDLTSAHLVYAYVAQILFNDLEVKTWDTDGDYLWPLDKTAPGAVFNFQKYVDYIRGKRVFEFYNKCHSAEDGTFCKTPGEPGHEGHTTAAEAEAEADEYRGGHQPPSPQNSDRLDALGVEGENGSTFPADVYDHPEHYSFGEGAAHRESVAVIRRVKGNPDAPVKLYRAAPEGANSINKGDWVAISKSYAEEHAAAQAPEGETWNVYEIEVPAHTIHNGGNDIIEWGYWGDDKPAKVVKAVKGEPFEPYTSNFAARYLDVLSERAIAELHLRGQHDQDSHGRRGGISANAEIFKQHPNLRPLGNSLQIKGDPNSPTIQNHLGQLNQVPAHIHKRVADAGVKVIIGEGSVTELGTGMAIWKGVTPRGWPKGYTWDSIDGVYDDTEKEVVLGHVPNSVAGTSFAVHEYGHAVDDVYRYSGSTNERSHSANWTTVWHASYNNLNNEYFKQDNSWAGAEEFFAESFSNIIKGDSQAFRDMGLSNDQGKNVVEYFSTLLKPKEED